jgi:hypothetical protein
MEAWCERWNIKINEDKTRGIYFYYPSIEIAAPTKQGTPHYWQFSKAHTDP